MFPKIGKKWRRKIISNETYFIILEKKLCLLKKSVRDFDFVMKYLEKFNLRT